MSEKELYSHLGELTKNKEQWKESINPAKVFYERNGFVVVDENYSHYILRYGSAV